MSKRAILYTRVSTDEQALRGYSLRDQYEKLKTYCTIHGIEEVAHFQDDHSAKSFDRPEFKKLLEFLRQNKGKIDLLIFIKWDRFSRNAPESYEMLKGLKKYNIEAHAIEQPLNMAIPESKIMLSIYLSTPEVENDRRSLNTISGMRRSIKEGRWCGKAPKGYDNKRDEKNRPIIVPNSDAVYITKAFELINSGDFIIESVRKKLVREGFKCGKSFFPVLLRNEAYMGKVKLAATKEESEQLIQGIHKPIISEETFYVVQDVLKGKRPKMMAPKYGKKSELPLRGFLICPKCGKLLTGSASKGNGGKYYYYHCSNGCKERVRASNANIKFEELLEKIKPKEEIKSLYEKILKDLFNENAAEAKISINSLDTEITKLKQRIESLQDKFTDNHIELKDYIDIKNRYELQIKQAEEKRQSLSGTSREFYDQLVFSFSFLRDLPSRYSEATIDIQQRIIGSIFPEKLEFFENKYRTKRVNAVVELISNIDKPFGRNENGQFSKKSELSAFVPEAGIEPARDCSHWFLRPTRLPIPPLGRE